MIPMKKNVFFLILFIVITTVARSQQQRATQEVIEAVETLNKVMITPDRNILEAIIADSLSYGHSSGLVQDKKTFINDLMNGPFDFLTISVTSQTVKIVGDIAIVRQIFGSNYKKDGVTGDLKIGNTLVWHKENKKWKLLVRQAFKL